VSYGPACDYEGEHSHWTNSILSLSGFIFASFNFFLLSYSLLQLPWNPRMTELIDKHLYDKGLKILLSKSKPRKTDHHPLPANEGNYP
jgi:hypothetical protein